MKKTIRLLIVDDHRFFRNALLAPLYEDSQIEVVGEAENGVVAKEMIRQFRPDIVLMDLHMPDLDGIQATRQILKEELYSFGVIVVTGDHDPNMAMKALKAGVRGYLLKETINDEALCAAIRAVYLGDAYFDGELFGGVLATIIQSRDVQTNEGLRWQNRLKAAELAFIFDIASGKETAEIAHEYQVSTKTVANRLTKLYNLFGVANRVQLVTFALRNGLISLSDI